MALTLAEAGANVAVCSRRIEAYERVVREIEALGGQAFALALGVTDFESVIQNVDKVISHFSTR